jgi:hypothetical protein
MVAPDEIRVWGREGELVVDGTRFHAMCVEYNMRFSFPDDEDYVPLTVSERHMLGGFFAGEREND